jgi:hypothetical protein
MNYLKFFLLFGGYFFMTGLRAQTSADTLDMLEQKANTYLNEMYVQQHFETAVLQWTDSVYEDISEIYMNLGKTFPSYKVMMEKTTKDFEYFFSICKHYQLGKIEERKITSEPGQLSAYFQYTYTDEMEGKPHKESAILYFYYNQRKSVWQIFDFRMSDIIRKHVN